jgi:hypothetical protein
VLSQTRRDSTLALYLGVMIFGVLVQRQIHTLIEVVVALMP